MNLDGGFNTVSGFLAWMWAVVDEILSSTITTLDFSFTLWEVTLFIAIGSILMWMFWRSVE